MDAGPPVGGLDTKAGAVGIAQGLGVRLGTQRFDQVHGGVQQEAGGLA